MVGYAHYWINGENTFVKVCTYVAEDVPRPRRFVVHPDAYCPPQITLNEANL